MADQAEIPEPTELIYVPSPSWAPAFAAAGLMLLTIGTFKGSIYLLVGAVLLIRAIVFWARDSDRQARRLPRRQRLTTAVIPASTLKRR